MEDRDTEKAYAYIMAQLMESPRFKEFFHMNYTLGKYPKDDNPEEFYYLVEELPDNEVMMRMQAKVAEKVKKVGTKKIKTVDATVLDKLGKINPQLIKK